MKDSEKDEFCSDLLSILNRHGFSSVSWRQVNIDNKDTILLEEFLTKSNESLTMKYFMDYLDKLKASGKTQADEVIAL